MQHRSVTIADVAELAGVSRSAVSKVIRNAYGVSEDMRTRVEGAVQELGYRPSVVARAMRGASFTIGVELPNTANPFFEGIIHGLSTAVRDSAYRIVISPSGDLDSTPALQTLVDLQVDGIVAVSSHVHPDILESMARQRPLVLLGRHEHSHLFDTLVDDDALGTRLVLQHLLDLGHQAIAHLTIESSQHPWMQHSPHAVRAKSYDAFMTSAGLQHHRSTHFCASTEESAYTRTLEILAGANPPTAISAGHDELALGVLRARAERGLGSGDLSVAGYDDSRIASHPLISLTTVKQSASAIGERIGALLLERLAGRRESVHEVITPELRVRNSTAPPVH